MVSRGPDYAFSLIFKDGSVFNLKPRLLHLLEEDHPLPDNQVNEWAPAPV
jgi:hypothetical protein